MSSACLPPHPAVAYLFLVRRMADDITARSLTLVDAAGRPRIMMSAGGEDGYANLTIASTTGELVEISAQPNGTIALSFHHSPRTGLLTITKRGLNLRARDGKFAVTIGDMFDDGVERLTVYRDGQPVWEMPQRDGTPNV